MYRAHSASTAINTVNQIQLCSCFNNSTLIGLHTLSNIKGRTNDNPSSASSREQSCVCKADCIKRTHRRLRVLQTLRRFQAHWTPYSGKHRDQSSATRWLSTSHQHDLLWAEDLPTEEQGRFVTTWWSAWDDRKHCTQESLSPLPQEKYLTAFERCLVELKYD